MWGTEPTELKRRQEVVAATRSNCSIDNIGCTRCCISARVACHSVVTILILLLLLEAACFIEGACCMLRAHWPGRTTPTRHPPSFRNSLCAAAIYEGPRIGRRLDQFCLFRRNWTQSSKASSTGKGKASTATTRNYTSHETSADIGPAIRRLGWSSSSVYNNKWDAVAHTI